MEGKSLSNFGDLDLIFKGTVTLALKCPKYDFHALSSEQVDGL